MTIDNNNFQLSVQNYGQPSDIAVNVSRNENLGRQAEIDVERASLVPPDQINTDLPDSNSDEGNSMKCLQKMLLEAAGLDHLKGKARMEAFEALRENVLNVKGKYLKDGTLANSPPVADVHHDPLTGKNFFKYLVTWEIETTINGNPVTLKKTQWIVTGVEIPERFDEPKFIRQKFHFAFLALKLHITTHKAATNPNEDNYKHVRRCVNDLMKTNLCGYEGYRKEHRLGFTNEEYASGVSKFRPSSTVGPDRAATTLAVTLFDDTGKKMVLFQNQTNIASKLRADNRKYDKEPVNKNDNRQILLGSKRLSRALDTKLRYPEFVKHQEIMESDPDTILELINSSRIEGKNLRGLEPHQRAGELYNSILSQHSTMERNATHEQNRLFGETIQLGLSHGNSAIGNYFKGLGYTTGIINIDYKGVKNCTNDLRFSELSKDEQKKNTGSS